MVIAIIIVFVAFIIWMLIEIKNAPSINDDDEIPYRHTITKHFEDDGAYAEDEPD